tara:strand:- start:332 stop:574 length:243 start_codon:yes stop_codon:yes gene_type:complete
MKRELDQYRFKRQMAGAVGSAGTNTDVGPNAKKQVSQYSTLPASDQKIAASREYRESVESTGLYSYTTRKAPRSGYNAYF